MSLSTDFTMPLAPAGGGYGNSNNGWGDWIWIIVLFLFAGGWGNGWGGNGGGTGATYTDSSLQRGFDTQSIQNKLDSITNGMCQQGYQEQQSFHEVDNAVCQLGYQVQQGFNSTNVALLQGQFSLASLLADCCCSTLRGLVAVNYNLATQVCGLQNTINNSTRDILEQGNANTRAILDYLTTDKIATLQNENQSLRLAASQTAQNAALISAMSANTNEIISRTAPLPTPSYIVNPPFPILPPRPTTTTTATA